MRSDSIAANGAIRARKVILIDDQGVNIGELDLRIAISKATEVSLDLVQVGIDSRSQFPVCKIMDLGKYKYEQSKKKQPKNHGDQIKEIRFGLTASEHDIEYRKLQAAELIQKKYKVKLFIKLKGRQRGQQQQAREILLSHAKSLSSVAKHDVITSSDNVVSVMLNPI